MNFKGLLALVILGVSTAGFADEGMWTFDNPPLQQLKDRYGFTPTQQWLDHIRLSSIRFNDGYSDPSSICRPSSEASLIRFAIA